MSIDELAELSTVAEAASFLRIGRGMAYRAARRYLDTDGAYGLPVIELGRHFRVPKEQLRRVLTGELRLDDPSHAVNPSPTPTNAPTQQPAETQLRLIDADSA